MVEEAVFQAFFRVEPVVAVVILQDGLEALAGALSGDLCQALLHVQNQLSLGADIRCGTANTAEGLVHQDAGVRGCVALADGACGEQELTHGCCHTGHHGHHVVRDELHGVIDSHAGGDGAAGRVDVQVNVCLGVFSREQQHLGADEVGVGVAHLGAEPDNALLQEAVVDVIFLGTNDGGCHRRRGRHAGCLGGADGQRHVAGHSSSSSLMGLRCIFARFTRRSAREKFRCYYLTDSCSPPLPFGLFVRQGVKPRR